MHSDRPRYEEIEIEYLRDGWREVATVSLTVWPGDEGCTWRLPEDCWPAEPGEWQIDRIEVWSDALEHSVQLGADAAERWEREHFDAVDDAVRALDGVVW